MLFNYRGTTHRAWPADGWEACRKEEPVTFFIHSNGPMCSHPSSCVPRVRICPRARVTHPSECVTLLSRSTCPVAHPVSAAALARPWERRTKREALCNLFITDLKSTRPLSSLILWIFRHLRGRGRADGASLNSDWGQAKQPCRPPRSRIDCLITPREKKTKKKLPSLGQGAPKRRFSYHTNMTDAGGSAWH